MKQEITIRPKGLAPGGTTVLTGQVIKDGQTYIITNRLRVLKNVAELAQGESMLVHYFSEQNPALKILFDDEKQEDKSKKDAANLFMLHDLVEVLGGKNPNCKNPMFVLENARTKKRDEALKIKKMGLVYNTVNKMQAYQMRDVAYTYNLPGIDKMSPIDVFIALTDFRSGILMQPQNIDKFLDSKLHEQEVYVITKKAIALGIFKMENGFYFNGGTQIGTKFEDVYQYCKSDTSAYNSFIKPQVLKSDVSGDEWSIEVSEMITSYYSETPAKPVRGKKEHVSDKLKELREEAEKAGVENVNIKTEEQLKVEIQEKMLQAGEQ